MVRIVVQCAKGAIHERVCFVFTRTPRFVDGKDQLTELLEHVRLCACRHCGAHDTLIGHGFLRGYQERSGELMVRGRRLFCSNRGRKRGCGRTVSVLLAELVEGFSLSVATLWALFCGLSLGLSVSTAAANASWPLVERSAYRLARRVRVAALSWRTWLSTRGDAPSSDASEPLAQLKEHLMSQLGTAPFARLQMLEGRGLLS